MPSATLSLILLHIKIIYKIYSTREHNDAPHDLKWYMTVATKYLSTDFFIPAEM